MFGYKDMVIVTREGTQSTKVMQCTDDILVSANPEEQARLRKTFRYLSLFDLSRSEMFFSKKTVLVEGDTEKFIIPFWAMKFSQSDSRYDLPSNNICVIECGGKANLHIFMRVLNRFKISYVVVHDIDPISFLEDKAEKTDKEKGELRMFKENDLIEQSLDPQIGKIIRISPALEKVVGISNSQADKEGKVGAIFFKYDELKTTDYPAQVKTILDLIINWDKTGNTVEING